VHWHPLLNPLPTRKLLSLLPTWLEILRQQFRLLLLNLHSKINNRYLLSPNPFHITLRPNLVRANFQLLTHNSMDMLTPTPTDMPLGMHCLPTAPIHEFSSSSLIADASSAVVRILL
jgi:hypothetical protein